MALIDMDRRDDMNQALQLREQLVIIQDDYDAIRAHHGPVGDAMTHVLTWTANNPIPGGRPYRDVVTRDIDIPSLGLDTPKKWPPSEWVPIDYDPITITLPRGNVANFNDRWEWIDADMLPAYEAVPGEPIILRSLIETPVAVRAEEDRFLGFSEYPN